MSDDAVTVERLLTLDAWVHENCRALSIWRSGSPNLYRADDFPKWIKRHEARLTASGAMLRIGNARRIVEPAFRPVLLEILREERERANRKAGR